MFCACTYLQLCIRLHNLTSQKVQATLTELEAAADRIREKRENLFALKPSKFEGVREYLHLLLMSMETKVIMVCCYQQ